MRLLKKLVFVAIAFTAAFALAEVAVRVAGVKPPGLSPFPVAHVPGMMVPHPLRGYACAPGSSGEVVRGGRRNTIRINERGFRDRPFAVPAGTRVVLAAGDSFTVGWGLEEQETWPRRLEERLEAAASSGGGAANAAASSGATATGATATGAARWRVLNAGVSGYNMRQARLTAEELLAEVKPQVVVLGVHTLGFDRLANPYVVHEGLLIRQSQVPFVSADERGVFETTFRRRWMIDADRWLHHHFVVGALVLRGAETVTRSWRRPPAPPPADPSEAALREALAPLLAEVGLLRDAAQRAGAAFVALVIAVQNADGAFHPAQDTLDSITAEYCAAQHIPCARTLAPLRERAGGKPIFRLPDNLHWTAAANDVAAEVLLPFVGAR